jgi:hypothetical protein
MAPRASSICLERVHAVPEALRPLLTDCLLRWANATTAVPIAPSAATATNQGPPTAPTMPPAATPDRGDAGGEGRQSQPMPRGRLVALASLGEVVELILKQVLGDEVERSALSRRAGRRGMGHEAIEILASQLFCTCSALHPITRSITSSGSAASMTRIAERELLHAGSRPAKRASLGDFWTRFFIRYSAFSGGSSDGKPPSRLPGWLADVSSVCSSRSARSDRPLDGQAISAAGLRLPPKSHFWASRPLQRLTTGGESNELRAERASLSLGPRAKACRHKTGRKQPDSATRCATQFEKSGQNEPGTRWTIPRPGPRDLSRSPTQCVIRITANLSLFV